MRRNGTVGMELEFQRCLQNRRSVPHKPEQKNERTERYLLSSRTGRNFKSMQMNLRSHYENVVHGCRTVGPVRSEHQPMRHTYFSRRNIITITRTTTRKKPV